MFHHAQIKLTIFYSLLFLLLFWIFSFGLYTWMDNSVGEGYISQVQQKQGSEKDIVGQTNSKMITIAGDVALDKLATILIFLNGGLLVLIPIASFFLAKQTLSPIQIIYEQQKQFVSDVSHEMRTPLSIISGEIEIILHKEHAINHYKRTFVSIKEETDRLSQLIKNLLFLAKNDQNNTVRHTEYVDIIDLIYEVNQSLLLKSKKKHLAVTFTTKDTIATPPTIRGHYTLLRQLFYNLLNNAIMYTPPYGKITILLVDAKNTIVVSIHDTGIGITKENQKKIFDRFFRVDTSRGETKGYGLGLAIVKSAVVKHHGKVSVSSQEGKGSTFTIVLPK